MSESTRRRLGDLVGTIRHRLLINRLADPAEVEPRLPANVRPHITSTGGVVVGCCLIAIETARPWPIPSFLGPKIYAAAHRISVETGPAESPTPAVYVPMRHSNSRPTVAIGGPIVSRGASAIKDRRGMDRRVSGLGRA